MSRIAMIAFVLAGCAQHVTALDQDAGPGGDGDAALTCYPPRPELPLCTAPIRNFVSPFPGVGGFEQIRAVPDETFAGIVTIVSATRLEEGTTIVVDHDGTERTITIAITSWDPPIAAGDELVARLIADDPLYPDELSAFFLRTTTDELRAGWIRAANRVREVDLSALLHTSVRAEVQCYQPTGGQCGRGLHQRMLYGSGGIAEVGVPTVFPTFDGPIELTIGSLYDDGWFPASGACAIGLLGGAFIDVRPAPP